MKPSVSPVPVEPTSLPAPSASPEPTSEPVEGCDECDACCVRSGESRNVRCADKCNGRNTLCYAVSPGSCPLGSNGKLCEPSLSEEDCLFPERRV
jgi:hypothetical protein